MSEEPLQREAYEGVGGWNDGRLGQAYDLISAVIKEIGERTRHHPLLAQIETMDEKGKSHAGQ